MASAAKLILLGTTINADTGVSPGLCDMHQVPLVNYWLLALRSCPRLLPLVDKVFIVTSAATHQHYMTWALDKDMSIGGFPSSNLLCTGQEASSQPLQDLAFAMSCVPGMADGYVMVASLDHFWGPELPLQQLLEHTVVRGKDTLAFARPPPGQSLQGTTAVELDMHSTTVTGQLVNPRVNNLLLSPMGLADGVTTSVMAPLLILHKSSLQHVHSAASNSAEQGFKQLGVFVQTLLGAGKPVYGLAVDVCLNCSTLAGLEYADGFMQHLQEQQRAAQMHGPAAVALAQVQQAAKDSGVTYRMDKSVEDLLSTASPVKRALLMFDALAPSIFAARSVTQAVHTGHGGAPVKHGVWDRLPERFADATTRRHKIREQHPVYQTTANEIGKRAPVQIEMPDVYAGSTGAFTRTFAGPYRNLGLNTHTTTSKVHKALDDF